MTGSENPSANDDDFNTVRAQIPANQAAILRLVNSLDKQPGQTLKIEHHELPPGPAPRPAKREARRRNHRFYKLQSFVNYLKRYGHPGHVTVFVDPERHETQACLNEISPHEVEVISYAPKPRRPWQMLVNHFERSLRVHDLQLLLRAIQTHVSPESKEELESALEGLAFGKAAQICEKTESDPRIIAVRVGSRTLKECRIPEQLKMTIVPYLDSPGKLPLSIYIDILRQSEEAIAFRIDSPEYYLFIEHNYQQTEKQLIESLAEIQACVSIGQLKRNDWNYQPQNR